MTDIESGYFIKDYNYTYPIYFIKLPGSSDSLYYAKRSDGFYYLVNLNRTNTGGFVIGWGNKFNQQQYQQLKLMKQQLSSSTAVQPVAPAPGSAVPAEAPAQQLTSEKIKTKIKIFIINVTNLLIEYVKTNYNKYLTTTSTEILTDEIKTDLRKYILFYVYLIVMYFLVSNQLLNSNANIDTIYNSYTTGNFSFMSKLNEEATNIGIRKEFYKFLIDNFFTILNITNIDDAKKFDICNTLKQDDKLNILDDNITDLQTNKIDTILAD